MNTVLLTTFSRKHPWKGSPGKGHQKSDEGGTRKRKPTPGLKVRNWDRMAMPKRLRAAVLPHQQPSPRATRDSSSTSNSSVELLLQMSDTGNYACHEEGFKTFLAIYLSAMEHSAGPHEKSSHHWHQLNHVVVILQQGAACLTIWKWGWTQEQLQHWPSSFCQFLFTIIFYSMFLKSQPCLLL